MLEVYKRVCWPQPLSYLFSRDQLARAFQKHRQHLKRLAVKLDCQTIASQFTASKVNFEVPKPNDPNVGALRQ
jgi:hypothetical protein